MAVVKQELKINENNRNFWKGDYGAISAELNNINWAMELNSNDINELWDRFEKIVNDLIFMYVPKQQLKKHKKR